MNTKYVPLLYLAVIAMSAIVACSSGQQEQTTSARSGLVRGPEAVVFYVDIHYPGIPEPTKTPNDRYCEFLPSVLIWGDGLVFLDENILNERASVQSGLLNSTALQQLSEILESEDFFTAWQAPGPNTAGTWWRIGAQLPGKPIAEYSSGDLEPPLYKRILAAIIPNLKPLAEHSTVDARIETILNENANCNAYLYTK